MEKLPFTMLNFQVLFVKSLICVELTIFEIDMGQ